MKRKNMTRNALVSSIISLLLCVSMLVGTTFAWFTDEVQTGMNTIAAGNLDVELLADGVQVDSNTKLFDKVDLWEPGVVVYENLQVANVGTLALKYQMSLNFGNENNLNGHKLSEVLKIAIVDKIAAGATRADVLAAAKAANPSTLANFVVNGELLAGEKSDEQTVVIFWAPNANEVDNLYNANNGQVTSDLEPLHIEFGINLQATQLMHEEDSFDSTYDESASIMPKATVNMLDAQEIIATTTFPNGTDPKPYNAPFVMQFLPNETADEAASSDYKLWHADYIVKADKDVPANSMALAGYYAAFCEDFNNDNWVALSSAETIAANSEIRLVSGMTGVTVNYEEICEFGNDGIGFLCSAIDLTGENAGTTLTVELRVYAVPEQGQCTEGNGCKHPYVECETGESYVIGTYTYTFGAQPSPIKYVASAAEMQAALDNAADGDIIALTADINGDVVAPQKPDVKVIINGQGHKFTGTLTVNGKSAGYATAGLSILDVNFDGGASTDAYIALGGDNSMRYTNNVTVKDCTFSGLNNEDVAIKSYTGGDKNLTIDGCVVNNGMHSLLQVTNVEEGLKITNCEVYSKNGANLNNTPALEMSGCTFDVTGYAIRAGVNGTVGGAEKVFKIVDSSLKSACAEADDAVIVLRDSAKNADLKLVNTTVEGPRDILK